MSLLLAGDVGGTKTQLGLFEPAPARPRPLAVRVFGTLEYDDLSSMLAAFVDEVAPKGRSIDGACFGVAGPVIGHAATLTNIARTIDARQIADRFGWTRVNLLNDLQ